MTAIIIIPCAAAKLDAPAAARDLYNSANFRHMLAAAEAEAAAHTRDLDEAARVVILSALHGLVELDEVLAPYNVKMTDRTGTVSPARIAAQLRGIGAETVVTMLPAAYAAALTAAVAEINDDEDGDLWISTFDAYEAAPGIGFQRGVASSLVRTVDVWVAAPVADAVAVEVIDAPAPVAALADADAVVDAPAATLVDDLDAAYAHEVADALYSAMMESIWAAEAV